MLLNSKILFIYLLIVLTKVTVFANICVSKTTCRECITTSSTCAWCKMLTNDELIGNPKCDHISNIIKFCKESDIVHPNSTYQITMNDEFKSSDTGLSSKSIQLKPQILDLKLRPHTPIRFNVSYKLAENYPVDLYFLMDLSQSMSTHKDKLSKLGQTLAANMRNITKNFRLGFGSFVEKETMPFVNTAPRNFLDPCPKKDNSPQQCVSPYSFINHMKLSDNASKFETEVTHAKVSGNLDSPEGGFDALMQTIVCGENIGWRNDSRKLVVYSTDAGFHYAGDGKLAGIVEPNDGQCHLHGNSYSYSLIQDYPSIGQLIHKISQKNINMIFAVVQDQVELYQTLSDLIEGSYVGVLDTNASNIVELVTNSYKNITKKVTFGHSINTPDMEIKFYSKCKGDKLIETQSCDNLAIAEQVDFEVEIVLKKCPEPLTKNEKSRMFKITVLGIEQQVTVNWTPECECQCEKENNHKNDPYCNNRGKVVCGSCDCNDSSFGPKCECSLTDGSDLKGNLSACMNPSQTGVNKLICSNQGRCSCGQCICNDPTRISGKYCECDNESCDRYKNLVCAGNGRCECGICRCEEGWSNSDCSCSTRTDTCTSSNGLICNNRGNCVCGKCECDSRSGFFGRTCEDCPNCPLPCENNRDCVQCKGFGTGKRKGSVDCDACNITFTKVERLEISSDSKKCQYVDSSDNCTFYFSYLTTNDKIITIQSRKDCPSVFPIWAIGLIIVATVLLIGLVLLIGWKIVDNMQQKREVARFNEEKKKANWGTNENPLFKPARSKFENPIYSKIKQ